VELAPDEMSKSDILVRRIKIWGEGVGIARDDKIDAVIRAAMAKELSVVLEPGGKLELRIVIRNPDSGKVRPFLLIVSWRRTSSMWLPLPAKFLLSSVRGLQAIDAAT
jgi:hypothetical protein